MSKYLRAALLRCKDLISWNGLWYKDLQGVTDVCRTLYLFTKSDLKTILIPTLLCGLVDTMMFSSQTRVVITVSRICAAVAWIWLNLLACCVHNQSSAQAVEEDKINKPWRPLPSGRLTLKQSQKFLNVLYPLLLFVSIPLGGFLQTGLLIFLNFCYNSWGGSDAGAGSRALLNSLGFSMYNSGAFAVMSRSPTLYPLPAEDYIYWKLCIALFIFTTIHVQDFEDLQGDLERGRATLPILWGDSLARNLTIIPISIWVITLSLWWNPGPLIWFINIIGGLSVLWCLLTQKDRARDKWALKNWCLWLLSIYALPLIDGL